MPLHRLTTRNALVALCVATALGVAVMLRWPGGGSLSEDRSGYRVGDPVPAGPLRAGESAPRSATRAVDGAPPGVEVPRVPPQFREDEVELSPDTGLFTVRPGAGTVAMGSAPSHVLPDGVARGDVAFSHETGLLSQLRAGPVAASNTASVPVMQEPSGLVPGDVQVAGQGSTLFVSGGVPAPSTAVAPPESRLPEGLGPADVAVVPGTGGVLTVLGQADARSTSTAPEVLLPPNVHADRVVVSPESGTVTLVDPAR